MYWLVSSAKTWILNDNHNYGCATVPIMISKSVIDILTEHTMISKSVIDLLTVRTMISKSIMDELTVRTMTSIYAMDMLRSEMDMQSPKICT